MIKILKYIIILTLISVVFIGCENEKNKTVDEKVLDAVKKFIYDTTGNPDSVSFISYTKVELTSDNEYFTKVKYREMNSFGGYDIQFKSFLVDKNFKVVFCMRI